MLLIVDASDQQQSNNLTEVRVIKSSVFNFQRGAQAALGIASAKCLVPVQLASVP
jgi:hypothetical protein